MNTAVLYLRAVVQTFPTDDALVKHVAKFTDMPPNERTAMGAALAALRRDGAPVRYLKGGDVPTVLVALPGGRAGLGVVITADPPAELAAVAELCREYAKDLEPGFMLLVIPAGVVAGVLQ